MKATIELIAQLGGLVLIFTIVWAFIRFTGYGKFYDKMMCDDDETTNLTLKNNNKDNDDDIIQHLSV